MERLQKRRAVALAPGHKRASVFSDEWRSNKTSRSSRTPRPHRWHSVSADSDAPRPTPSGRLARAINPMPPATGTDRPAGAREGGAGRRRRLCSVGPSSAPWCGRRKRTEARGAAAQVVLLPPWVVVPGAKGKKKPRMRRLALTRFSHDHALALSLLGSSVSHRTVSLTNREKIVVRSAIHPLLSLLPLAVLNNSVVNWSSSSSRPSLSGRLAHLHLHIVDSITTKRGSSENTGVGLTLFN